MYWAILKGEKKKESLPISLMYQHDQGQSLVLTVARPMGGWLAMSVTLCSQVPEMWPPESMTQVGPLGGSSRWNLQCKRLRNLLGSLPQSLLAQETSPKPTQAQHCTGTWKGAGLSTLPPPGCPS